jgi:hypothetical protein
MSIELSITRAGPVSGTLKSFLHHVRSMLAGQDAAPSDRDYGSSDWDAFLSETSQHSELLPQDARERRAAIEQIMHSADGSAKISIADWLLFANDVNEAHDAILRDQRQREAA